MKSELSESTNSATGGPPADIAEAIAGLSPRARTLFEAQLQFELAALEHSPTGLVETELGLLFDWLSKQTLPDLIDSQELFGWLKRRLLEQNPAPETGPIIDAVATAIRAALTTRTETAGDVVSHEAFQLLVKDLSADEALRDTVIDGMVHNAVFSLVISEILYHGIADFMLESKFTNSIPGAQSLFKLGQNLLNQTAPGLKDGFEKTIKEFIKNNAGRIIENSEAPLKKSLNPATIQQAADQFWDEFKNTPINTITTYVSAEKLPSYRATGDLFARKLRESPVAADLLKTGIDAAFQALEKQPLAELFRQAGVDRDAFVAELSGPARYVTRRARNDGYATALIQRRLLAFYGSATARALLD